MNQDNNSNIIKNDEQQVPKTREMSDCDYLNDLLSTTKSIANNYSIVISEASNDDLYNEYIKLFKDTQDCQRRLFNLLFKKGWYKLEKADQTKVVMAREENEQQLNELI